MGIATYIDFILIILSAVVTICTISFIVGLKLSKLESKLDDLEPLRINSTGLMRMMAQVEKIIAYLINSNHDPFLKQSSPVSLTEKGLEIANKINSEQLATKYVTRIRDEIQDMNAYQIQEHCFRFARNDLLDILEQEDKGSFDKISDLASEQGIQIDNILSVIGVNLRDETLKLVGKLHEEVDELSLSGETNT